MTDFSRIFESFSETQFIRSGFGALDLALGGGWLPGQLVVVGGRHGSGTSDLAFDFAIAAGRANLPAGIISLCMSVEEVVQRLLAATSSTPLRRLVDGDLTDPEADLTKRTTAELAELPLFIQKGPIVSVDQLMTNARDAHGRHQLRLIVIDSFQDLIVRDNDSFAASGEHIARLLKGLARELRVSITLVVHLEEDTDRPDRRPVFGDLSDVGKLDWFADTVLFVHRPDYAGYPAGTRPEIAEIIVAKSPYGQPKMAYLVYQPDVCRFDSLPRRTK